MQKHNHLFTILTAAVLLGGSIPTLAIAAKPQTVVQAAQEQEITSMSAPEDFNAITGHDYQHPIWPNKSLGVIVTTNNPTFLQEVHEACQAWSPAFNLHDYGYVNLKPGQKIDTEQGKLRFVYVSDVDLSAGRAEEHNDKNGDTTGIDPYDTDSNGYFKMPYVKVRVDSAYNAEAFSQYASPYAETVSALEHELGHAIGMRHSTDTHDVLYAHDLDNTVQDNELAAVERLYRGVPDGNYPDQLTIISPKKKNNTSTDNNSDSVDDANSNSKVNTGTDSNDTNSDEDTDSSYDTDSYPRNRFYMRRKNADKLIDAIDDNLYVISSNRENLWYRNSFNYKVTKGGRNYTKRRSIPNGTYRVHYFGMSFSQLHPSASWQHDRFVFAVTDADIGDHLPASQQLHYCHGFYVRPYSRHSSNKISFTVYVRVHGKHFSLIR